MDGSGNLYIVDTNNERIRKVTAATGIITTVAGGGTGGLGDGGPATSAELNLPQGVAVDGSGNLFIADERNFRIRKVTAATGIITTIAANLGLPSDVAVDGSGNLYIAESLSIQKLAAATGALTTLAGGGLNTSIFPAGVAVGRAGQVFFSGSSGSVSVVTLINDSGAPASEITAGNGTSSDHLTFNLLIENSSGGTQSAAVPESARAVKGRAALSSSDAVTVGGTVTLTETLARDPSSPNANNVVVGATLPPTWAITSCLAGGVPCSFTGSNATVRYPVLASGQSPIVTIIADGPDCGAEQLDLSSASDSENLATALFSQNVVPSPGATITPSFPGTQRDRSGPGDIVHRDPRQQRRCHASRGPDNRHRHTRPDSDFDLGPKQPPDGVHPGQPHHHLHQYFRVGRRRGRDRLYREWHCAAERGQQDDIE